MQKILCVISLCFACLISNAQKADLKRYYTKISQHEFSCYDSVSLKIKSKYGNVYHAFQPTPYGIKLDFFVFEKPAKSDKKLLFKMDELTQIKNDSTFMLCDPPLKATSDTINWPNGIWFYKFTKSHESNFSVDSLPPNFHAPDYSSMNMGIYQYKDDKLVKISSLQSWDEFDRLNVNGFFYLPNPGFFYRLAKFDEIE